MASGRRGLRGIDIEARMSWYGIARSPERRDPDQLYDLRRSVVTAMSRIVVRQLSYTCRAVIS